MAIVVNSDQWTGESDDTPLAAPIVWGEFADRPALDRAVSRLEADGLIGRGDLAAAGWRVPADNEGQVPPPDVKPLQADARNQRQLHVGMAMAAASMAAAGVVIATGGAALPAAAAAVAAGGATGIAGEAAGKALEPTSTGNPPEEGRAAAAARATSGPALGLHAETAAKRSRAEEFLRACGARRIWMQETRAG